MNQHTPLSASIEVSNNDLLTFSTDNTDLISDAFILKLVLWLIILFGFLVVIYKVLKKHKMSISFLNRYLVINESEKKINVIAKQKISQVTTMYVLEFEDQNYLITESKKGVATAISPAIKIKPIIKEN